MNLMQLKDSINHILGVTDTLKIKEAQNEVPKSIALKTMKKILKLVN